MDVKSYEFLQFANSSTRGGEASKFEFKDLLSQDPRKTDGHQKVIKIERDSAKKSNFTISPIVRQHRGLDDQEIQEYEARVHDEVERRVAKIEEEAFQKGFEEGKERGMEEIFNQTRAETEAKLEHLSEIINQVMVYKAELLEREKKDVHRTIKNLSKWVILRELKDDGQYIQRLLEKLILELQTKTNLLIQVNQHHFEQMPDVLQYVEKKIGQLKNVRVEIGYDIEGPGMIVESENGIINGDLAQQFINLDKLFNSVGLEEKDSFPKITEEVKTGSDEGEGGESGQ